MKHYQNYYILINELNDKEGFSSYKEIQTWLYTVHDLDVTYKVVHDTVRYRLKAKLKVPRRSNAKKDVEAEAEFPKAHRPRCPKGYRYA